MSPMLNPPRSDIAKLLKCPDARAARLREIHAPHVAPLCAFVEELRQEAGPGAAIPNFDPWDAGIEAEILFLLEAPGKKAVGSSFVSRNNPDGTAKNFFELNVEAGIPREKTAIWNVVPWYIGDEERTKIRAATAKDLEAGLRPLPRLIELLPKLRTVVFMGAKAQKARSQVEALRPDLATYACPHPSPRNLNCVPALRVKILDALREVGNAHV